MICICKRLITWQHRHCRRSGQLEPCLPLWHCSTYSERTACHFARFTPDSDFFHHTFYTVHTVHSVCSTFTIVHTVHSVISIPRGRSSSTMGLLKVILQLELQPIAQVHPELQLQGNSHQAQMIILLILLNQVEPTIQLMRIGATLPPHELHEGSKGDGASPNRGIATRSCPISSPT